MLWPGNTVKQSEDKFSAKREEFIRFLTLIKMRYANW